jgi:hypothetical protein
MKEPKPMRLLAPLKIALVALPLALTLAGCDVMDYLSENNPLETKKKPLEGARKQLFPGGVPGIEYNQPPPQPTNSNIPVSAVPPQQEQTPQEQSGAQNPKQPARAVARTTRPVSASQPKQPNQTDDPWAEARPKQPGDDPWADNRPVR